MARIGDDFNPQHHGELTIVRSSDSQRADVHFTPPPIQLRQVKPGVSKTLPNRVKILEIDYRHGGLTIYPIVPFGNKRDFLLPKYPTVERISLLDATSVLSSHVEDESESIRTYRRTITFGETESLRLDPNGTKVIEPSGTVEEILEILEELPAGFIKDYDYGLGFQKKYRFIVQAVEKLSDANEIVISNEPTGLYDEGRKFGISWSDYEEIRKAVNRTSSLSDSARVSVQTANTHNYLAEKIGADKIPVKMGRHPLRKLFAKFLEGDGDILVSAEDQRHLLTAISRSAATISEADPQKLINLQNDIELVNLSTLIIRFEEMLQSDHEEKVWQRLLHENPLMLSMGFGYPIIMIQEKASVGGRKASGRGDKVTDFLMKNSMTNNAAIVEIKTPQTPLLNRGIYREDVFVPSRDLAGGITQVLDQRQHLQTEIMHLRGNDETRDLKTYAVQGCLIVGTMPDEEERRRSFEMFRSNSNAVVIVTFDELLERLKSLETFLRGEGAVEDTAGRAVKEEDLPF